MKIELDNLESFLTRNRISNGDWDKAKITIDELQAIVADYESQISHLNESAEFLAKVLQKCPQVHSVRWRVKDTEHLLEKIIRKRASGSDKYLEINASNYSQIITDLVGVRVLHLFKSEWLNIHSYILAYWEPIEGVKAYIREGDEGGIVDSYSENGCVVETHLSGYRSIHYIISTQPTIKKILAEIQVRTIFEEGWSEIDHKIRYPNFSDNKLIAYFLTIFNRMAGSADEMGTFVKDLTSEIAFRELENEKFRKNQEVHLSKIEALVSELSNEKEQSKNKDQNLKKLNAEINELRNNTKLSQKNVNSDNWLSVLDGASVAALAALGKNSAFNPSIVAFAGLDKVHLFGPSIEAMARFDKLRMQGISDAVLPQLKIDSSHTHNSINKTNDKPDDDNLNK